VLTLSTYQVIKESAELALSWVRAHALDLGIATTHHQDPLQYPRAIDIHLHLPAGAQRKDGPSAGIAMVCMSLISRHGPNWWPDLCIGFASYRYLCVTRCRDDWGGMSYIQSCAGTPN
jgi:hypothetical protein